MESFDGTTYKCERTVVTTPEPRWNIFSSGTLFATKSGAETVAKLARENKIDGMKSAFYPDLEKIEVRDHMGQYVVARFDCVERAWSGDLVI